MNDGVRYYLRESGIIVRLTNGVIVEYLNSECEWVPNQEWFLSMFVDGEDKYRGISEEEVNNYIENKLNSKMTR